jgi:site-specific recombinase XerD
MINTSKAYEDYVVFVDSKALRGRSKAEYLRQVRKLSVRYPERSLKQISERMVFDHLIYLRDKEKLRPSTLNQAVVALRMFYRDYLQRDWKLWEQFEIRRDQPLPMVLTRDEVHQLWQRCARTGLRRCWPLSITANCVWVKPCGCGQKISIANAGYSAFSMAKGARTARCRWPGK